MLVNNFGYFTNNTKPYLRMGGGLGCLDFTLGFSKMIYLQELQSNTGSISLVGSTLAGMTIAVDRFFLL